MTETEWQSSEDCHELLKFVAGQPRSWQMSLAAWLGVRSQSAGQRKTRLFGLACCRRIWPLLVDPRSRSAVEIYEQFLSGAASAKEMKRAVANAQAAAQQVSPGVSASPWDGAARARAAEAVAAAVDPHNQAQHAAAECREAVRATAMIRTAMEALLSPTPVRIGSNKSEEDSATNWFKSAPTPPTPNTQQLEASAQLAWLAERHAQADIVRDIFGNPFKHFSVNRTWLTIDVVAVAKTIAADQAQERFSELAAALEAAGCTNDDLLRHCRSATDHVQGCWVIDALLGLA